MDTMLVAAEAVLTETRETTQALTVSAFQQAHEMSHRAETTAESFFQTHKDMTVTSKEQARQKQLDFPESMKVFEEVTHVMSGRWVDTMKRQQFGDPRTPREVMKNLTVMKVALQQQQQYRASVCSWQGVSTNVIRDTKLFVADCTQAFLNDEVCEGEQLYAQPPEGWNPKILTDGRRVVWRVRKAMLGLRTSPRRWQEHLSGKLKEHGFVQDEHDPCLFTNAELDICTGVHVDDMLAVGPSELTKNLLQELSKDMTMRWSMVTDKPQEFLGRSLCRIPQGYTFLSLPDDNDTILDESGQRRHRQLLGRLLWLDRPDIKDAVCQLSTHVGTATTRDEINIKRLLRYLIRNPASNMIVGCNLDVPGIAGTPQGSVVVMADADWAGDVKDRRSYSGIAVWVKGSIENMWYPVCASSKKQNMVSGESELMALVGGACEGIATRDQWSKLCKCSLGMNVLCTDSSAALGFVKRKGASRRTRHVDTKAFFMQAWAMEPGQRILKVHGDSQQVADCLTKITTPSPQSSWTMTDATICRTLMRWCGRSLPTKSLHLT